MDTVITGLATANPPLEMSQDATLAFLSAHLDLDEESQALYRRLLHDGPIQRRFFGMEDLTDALETDPDRLLARYLHYARSTAVEAAKRALDEAGVSPDAVKGLIVNSCTGYLCPGLTAYLAEDLGLSTAIHHQDLIGMGCGAALPNLAAARGMLATDVEGPVLCVAVEICSATIFHGPERDLIVSNSIFGDGAAAAVVETAATATRPPLLHLRDFASGLFPRHREDLRYRTVGGRLRNHLSLRVPVIGARTVRAVASGLLEAQGLTDVDIHHWAVHPGGTVVLDKVTAAFNLDPEALRASYAVFRNYGNMSSPSVLFALRDILDNETPQAGERGMLLAFGAGFSAFALLVEF